MGARDPGYVVRDVRVAEAGEDLSPVFAELLWFEAVLLDEKQTGLLQGL